jgi:WD40 repeat protein
MKNIFLLLFVFVTGFCKGQKLELVLPAGHADNIYTTVVSPDNKYIVSSDASGVSKIWEKSSGRLVFTFPNGQYVFSKFFFRKNGKILLALRRDNLVVFDFENFSIIKEKPIHEVECAVMTSDETTLYLSSQEQMYHAEISKMRLDDYSVQKIYAIENKDIFDLSFSKISLNEKENRLLCYCCFNGTSLIDTIGNVLKIFPCTNDHALWCFAPDGSLVDIEGNYEKHNIFIKFLNPETNTEKWRTTILFKGSFSFFYNSQIAEFDTLHGNWVLSTQKDFAVLDYVNHKLEGVYEVPKGEVCSIYPSPISNEFIIGTNLYAGGAVSLYSFNSTKKEINNQYGSALMSAWSMKTPVTERTILIGSCKTYFKQINISKASFKVQNILHNYGSQKIGVSPDGKTGANASAAFINLYTTNDDPINNYDEIKTEGNDSSPEEIIFSSDGNLVATINSRETVIADVKTKKEISHLKIGSYGFVSIQASGAFSNDNKTFVSYSINDSSIRMVTCFNILTRKILWTKEGDIFSFKFTNDDKNIFCVDHDNNKLLWLNANTGEITKEKELPVKKGAVGNCCITKDFKYALINVKNNVEVWNIEKFINEGELKGHSIDVNYTAFLEDEKYFLTCSYDNTMRLWDWKNKKELCKFIFFEESEGWIALMPDGRFDASVDIIPKMYYARGKEIIPLESLYEKFYTPLLVNRIFNGEQFTPLDIDINTIKQKPTVKIKYAAVQRNLEVTDDTPSYQNTTGIAEIIVNASSKDDEIDEIRLFHNGKIVNLAIRGLFVTDDKTGNETKKYTLSLLPGQNTFRAVALNGQRTESKADEIAVNYKTDKPVENKPVQNNNAVNIDAVDKTATMYLVVIGINKYQNEKLSLNYALADATSFKEEIEKDAKTVLGNVKTFFITDNTADKKGITDALTEVQKNAKPQDVFVFYYAGHGYISDKTKEFYLVPTDVADIKNVDEVLLQKGISAKMLQTYAIDIQAQKQIFILDACQSAGAFEALLTSDANQQKSLAVVSRSTGTHWMAASGSQQYAQEFATLKHGAFTYVLLQALQGQAAANKMITVNGLKTFMQVQVPELMKKYNSAPQYPASYGLGNDFPVEIVK